MAAESIIETDLSAGYSLVAVSLLKSSSGFVRGKNVAVSPRPQGHLSPTVELNVGSEISRYRPAPTIELHQCQNLQMLGIETDGTLAEKMIRSPTNARYFVGVPLEDSEA